MSATIRSGPASRVSPIQTRSRSASVFSVAGDVVEDGDRRRPGGQRSAHAELGHRFALALDRGLGPCSLACRELADDDPADEQQDQVEPLARVADDERVERLDEQEVVSRNPPTAARIPAPVPNVIAQTSTARR